MRKRVRESHQIFKAVFDIEQVTKIILEDSVPLNVIHEEPDEKDKLKSLPRGCVSEYWYCYI